MTATPAASSRAPGGGRAASGPASAAPMAKPVIFTLAPVGNLAAQTVRGLAAADGEQGRQPRALARADRQRGPDDRGRPAPRRQRQSGGLPQRTQADHRVRRHHQAGKQTVGQQPRPRRTRQQRRPTQRTLPQQGNARREHPLGQVAPGLLLPGAHRPALGPPAPPGGTCASPTGDNVHVTRGSGPPRRTARAGAPPDSGWRHTAAPAPSGQPPESPPTPPSPAPGPAGAPAGGGGRCPGGPAGAVGGRARAGRP